MLELLKEALPKHGRGTVEEALRYLASVEATKEERGALMLRFLEQLAEGSPVSIRRLHKQPWQERAEAMSNEIVLRVQVEIPGLQELVAALKEQNAKSPAATAANGTVIHAAIENALKAPAAPQPELSGDDPGAAAAVAAATTRKPRAKRTEPPAPETPNPMTGAPVVTPTPVQPSKPVSEPPPVRNPSNEDLTGAYQAAVERGTAAGKNPKLELLPQLQKLLGGKWKTARECDDAGVRCAIQDMLNASYPAPAKTEDSDDLGL